MIRSTLLATAATLTMAGAAAAAPVSIDTFVTGQFIAAPGSTAPFANPVTDTVSAPEAIGGSRTVTAERSAADAAEPISGRQVGVITGFGSAGVFAGIDVTGTGTFSWNAGGADLVDGTNQWIDIGVLSADLGGVNYQLSVNSVPVSLTATAGTTLRYNFSAFAGVDFTNVSTISLVITGPDAFDTSMSFIGADGPAVPPTGVVPLPATALLALGGLGALAGLRRRKG